MKSVEVLNSIRNPGNMAYLQVNGQNQFDKEMNEIPALDYAKADYNALHRNELTEEYEAHGKVNDMIACNGSKFQKYSYLTKLKKKPLVFKQKII